MNPIENEHGTVSHNNDQSFTTNYTLQQNCPHLFLARKMQERTGEAVLVGDRVEFVFTRGTGPQYERVEEPHLARPEQIDCAYYFDKQIRTSLKEILGTIDLPRWNALEKKLLRMGANVGSGQREITSFFVRK